MLLRWLLCVALVCCVVCGLLYVVMFGVALLVLRVVCDVCVWCVMVFVFVNAFVFVGMCVLLVLFWCVVCD